MILSAHTLLMDQLKASREMCRLSGHDISRVSIGFNTEDNTVRVCDDTGAYDYHIQRNLIRHSRHCYGAPSRALESMVLLVETSQVLPNIVK